MYYLVKCPQSPAIALKRYREFLDMSGRGVPLKELNNFIRHSQLLACGLPWKLVMFGADPEAGEAGHCWQISKSLCFGEKLLVDELIDAFANFLELYDRIHDRLMEQMCFEKIEWIYQFYGSITTDGLLEVLTTKRDYYHKRDLEDIEKTRKSFRSLSEFFPGLDSSGSAKDNFFCDASETETDDIRGLFVDALDSIRFLKTKLNFLNSVLPYLVEHDDLRGEIWETIVQANNALQLIESQFHIVKFWHVAVMDDFTADYYIIDSSITFSTF